MTFAAKRYWLVGGSEGLGLALAQSLSQAGADLILSGRDQDRLDRASESLSRPAETVAMDIADKSSVTKAAARVGQIDGMVFLAGVYWPMKAQNWDADKVEAMCDINLTGCARVLGQVVPQMVARNSGHIVITGSLAGFRGLPGAIGYGASKAGVMSLAESLHADLRKTGVKVQLGNPGFVKTRLTAMNDFKMPSLMEPEAAAAHMMRLMASNRFSLSFPAGFSSVFRLGQFLPDWAYYRLFA